MKALKADVKEWCFELGFQQAGISNIDLTVAEQRLAKWLGDHIAKYEKEFGKIPTPEDLGKKAKDLPSGIIT